MSISDLETCRWNPSTISHIFGEFFLYIYGNSRNVPFVNPQNIDEVDDLMPSASRSLEGVTLTSQSLTSVQCQSIDSYTSSTVPSQCDTNVTNSDSLESASTDQSNTQSIDIEQVDTTVRSESHHVIQPMPLIYGNPPVAHQQPNLIFLQQPSSVPPVVSLLQQKVRTSRNWSIPAISTSVNRETCHLMCM